MEAFGTTRNVLHLTPDGSHMTVYIIKIHQATDYRRTMYITCQFLKKIKKKISPGVRGENKYFKHQYS